MGSVGIPPSFSFKFFKIVRVVDPGFLSRGLVEGSEGARSGSGHLQGVGNPPDFLCKAPQGPYDRLHAL